ncbi:hypothetical protein V6N13_023129 [Hibiscus sabdariffa]
MVFEIGVVELAFADNSNAVEGKNDYTYKEYGEDVKELESVTYTTMEKDKNMEVEGDRSFPGMEEEAMETMWVDKDRNNCTDREVECIKSHYNLEELMGGIPNGVKETFKEGCDGVEGRRSVGEVIKDDDSSKAGGLAQVETGEKVTIIAVGLADYVGDPNLDGLVGLDVQDAK